MDLSQELTKALAILLIEENPQHSSLIEEKFRSSFPHVLIKKSSTLKEASQILPSRQWDLILVGDKLPDGSGIDLLESISKIQPFASIAILTSDLSIDLPPSFNHHGTIELLRKDRQTLDSLVERVSRLISAGRRMDRLLRGEAGPNGNPIFQDLITGLYSRAYFEESLKREIERANRYGHEFSIVVIDIDGFSHINEAEGHSSGNLCLKKVASIIIRSIRSGDLVARYGNDEFILLLNHCRETDAIRCARRVLDLVKKTLKNWKLSVSVGIKHYRGAPKIERVEEFVQHAHKALKKAKQLGGNRFVLAA